MHALESHAAHTHTRSHINAHTQHTIAGTSTRTPTTLHRRTARRHNLTAAASGTRSPTVVLTREHGKNDKMLQELSARDIPCIELPLIEHASGPDRCGGVEQRDWQICFRERSEMRQIKSTHAGIHMLSTHHSDTQTCTYTSSAHSCKRTHNTTQASAAGRHHQWLLRLDHHHLTRSCLCVR